MKRMFFIATLMALQVALAVFFVVEIVKRPSLWSYFMLFVNTLGFIVNINTYNKIQKGDW